MVFKRKFGGRHRAFRKRPRFGTRRIFKRSRAARVTTLTGESGKTAANYFRGRKLTKRRWRNVLWRDTLAVQHYKSYAQLVDNQIGLLGTTLGKVIIKARPMITVDNSWHHTAAFWQAGGGAQPVEAGGTVEAFKGDITIRGGMCRYTVANPESSVPILLKVFAVWTRKNPSMDVYNRMALDVEDMEWDPTIIPEFSSFGAVMFKRETLLLPGGRPFSCQYRLRPQKVDQTIFRGADGLTVDTPAGNQPWWVYMMTPLLGNSTADDVISLISFNLSFSGDNIGSL